MASQFKELLVEAPVGGVVKDTDQYNVSPKFWATSDQFHPMVDRMEKYFGWERFVQPQMDGQINFCLEFERSTGERFVLLGTPTKLYLYNVPGAVFNIINPDDYDMELFNRWQHTVLNDRLYLTNGTDGIQEFLQDGTVKALVGDGAMPQAARFISNFNGHLLCGDIKDYDGTICRNRIRWCNFVQPTVWTPGSETDAGYLDLVDSPEPIMGFANLSPERVVVFRLSHVNLLTWTSSAPYISWEAIPNTNNQGLAFPYSLVEVNGQIYYIGLRDFYVLDSFTPKALGQDVMKEYFFNNVRQDTYYGVYGYAHPIYPEIWWVYISKFSTVFDKAVIYNWEKGVWTHREFFPHSALCTFRDPNARPISSLPGTFEEATLTWYDKRTKGNLLTLSGSPEGRVFLHGTVDTADGGPLLGTLESGLLKVKTKDYYKDWNYLSPDIHRLSAGDVTISVGRRYEPGSATLYLTPKVWTDEPFSHFQFSAPFFQWKLETAARCTVKDWMVAYRGAGTRR